MLIIYLIIYNIYNYIYVCVFVLLFIIYTTIYIYVCVCSVDGMALFMCCHMFGYVIRLVRIGYLLVLLCVV